MTEEKIRLEEKDDSAWVRQVLFVPRVPLIQRNNARGALIERSQEFSPGSLSFADTTLGGNRSINPRPQFTEFADPAVGQILYGQGKGGGMGRYYAEAIDSNAQRIYMQFGVPKFNSLTNFFANFYDSNLGRMTNTGSVEKFLYYATKMVGYITLFPITIIFGTLNILRGLYKQVTNQPLYRFYYMKPTMSLYWSMVQTISNSIAVNMGLTEGFNPYEYTRDEDGVNYTGQKTGQSGVEWSDKDRAVFQSMLPDIFRDESGAINVIAISTRYQRLANAHYNAMQKIFDNAENERDAQLQILDYLEKKTLQPETVTWNNIRDYMADYANTSFGKAEGVGDVAASAYASKQNQASQTETEAQDQNGDAVYREQVGLLATDLAAQNAGSMNVNKDGQYTGVYKELNDFGAHFLAEAREGSQFISFIVDYQDTIGESFNSSTRSSSIADEMNSTSAQMRELNFNLAGGNITDNIIGNIAESVIGGAKAIIQGALDSVNLGGLGAIGGAAFIDVPEFWENASVSLPQNSYTIQLRTPYGNPMSIYMDIMFPLACLLAGAVPRTTGRNSYTSPFLCKLWHKGRSQVQLGLIDSLSITRGTGNVGWNIRDQVLGIDVSFSVLNLSKMMHMPIQIENSLSDLLLDEYLGLSILDEENNFTDYMAVLGGLGYDEQVHILKKWRIRRAITNANWDTYFSMPNLIQWAVDDTLPGSLIQLVARDAAL